MESKEDDKGIILVHIAQFKEELLSFFVKVVVVAHFVNENNVEMR